MQPSTQAAVSTIAIRVPVRTGPNLLQPFVRLGAAVVDRLQQEAAPFLMAGRQAVPANREIVDRFGGAVATVTTHYQIDEGSTPVRRSIRRRDCGGGQQSSARHARRSNRGGSISRTRRRCRLAAAACVGSRDTSRSRLPHSANRSRLRCQPSSGGWAIWTNVACTPWLAARPIESAWATARPRPTWPVFASLTIGPAMRLRLSRSTTVPHQLRCSPWADRVDQCGPLSLARMIRCT